MTRGTLTEAGTESPFRTRPVEENLDLFRRMRAGEFPERRPGAARQDRHGVRQHQSARSGHVPHPQRAASAHRQRLAHLSELRFRPRPVGRHRGRHPLAVHARVRRPPAALRLVHREPAGAGAAAPVRVRASQSQLHAALQARADRHWSATVTSTAGTTRACRRSPGCAVVAFRRRRSAISSIVSVSPAPTAWSTSPCSTTRSARS